MEIEGEFHNDDFKFISIKLFGCDLDPQDCANDEEISKIIFNIVLEETTPNIMAKDREGLLMKSPDTRHFFYLNPMHR